MDENNFSENIKQTNREGGFGRKLFLLVVLSFLFRLVLLFLSDLEARILPDSSSYFELAKSLAANGEYMRGGKPELFRNPGYPLYLSFFMRMFEDWMLWAMVGQCLLASLSVLLSGLSVINLLGSGEKAKKTALLAGLLLALSPLELAYDLRFLSESLFSFMFLLFLYIWTKDVCDREFRPRMSFRAALALALATYVRTIALPIALIPFVGYLFKKQFLKACVFLVFFVAMIAPWFFRNELMAGYRGFSTSGPHNLYTYNAASLVAEKEGVAFLRVKEKFEADLAAFPNEAEAYTFAGEQGRKIILDAPFLYAKLHLVSCIRNFLPATGDFLTLFGLQVGEAGTLGIMESEGVLPAIKAYFGGRAWVAILFVPGVLFLLFQYICAARGVTDIRKQSQAWVLGVIVLMLLAFLFLPGAASHPRFRFPANPLICIFSAMGFMSIQHVCRNYLKKVDSDE